MEELEILIGLVLAATILAAVARRVGAPYPVFLALGGATLAFVPGAPSFTILPELALALFVAPVLLDAAFDASPRDLRDNWSPVIGLVVFAVGLTTIAVAAVTRALMPAVPWAAAIALGAVVAPPDAAAATAVLRQLRPPHRILTILQGESLLNDATALLIYRLAIGAVAAHGFAVSAVAPTFLFAVAGSLVVGPVLAWLSLKVMDRVRGRPDGDHPAVRHHLRGLDPGGQNRPLGCADDGVLRDCRRRAPRPSALPRDCVSPPTRCGRRSCSC